MIGDFDPIYSTNNIWFDEEFDQCLTLHLEKMKADIATLGSGNIGAMHTHPEYALATHVHTEYANAEHSHDNYASVDHTHTSYASLSDVTQLQSLVTELQNRITALENTLNSNEYIIVNN